MRAFSDLLLLAGRSVVVICGLIWWLRELQCERVRLQRTVVCHTLSCLLCRFYVLPVCNMLEYRPLFVL